MSQNEAPNKEEITDRFRKLQDDICLAIEAADTQGKFQVDLWEREGGGGGCSRVMTEGAIIEKGGVNFSAVHGETPEHILKALQLEDADFYATGVSVVMHPNSPMVPIIHMNVRYFEMSNGTCWFGGGIDLTPHYVDLEDARFFHQKLKQVCDRHHASFYQRFKNWADDYFFVKHRKETRGIGGIFFDRLSPDENMTKAQLFNFVLDVGNLLAPVYTHFMKKKRASPLWRSRKELANGSERQVC